MWILQQLTQGAAQGIVDHFGIVGGARVAQYLTHTAGLILPAAGLITIVHRRIELHRDLDVIDQRAPQALDLSDLVMDLSDLDGESQRRSRIARYNAETGSVQAFRQGLAHGLGDVVRRGDYRGVAVKATPAAECRPRSPVDHPQRKCATMANPGHTDVDQR